MFSSSRLFVKQQLPKSFKRLHSLSTSLIDICPEVQDALRAGSPVVALESTIITHGMPYPTNYQTALSVEAKVRSAGSIPATIGVVKGRILVGMDKAQLETLSANCNDDNSELVKISRRDLAVVTGLRKSGGTTIAATALIASMVGIRVFATGGLGGVHRGGEISWDVSADLTELGRTPISVVSAGVKSILDIGRTLEYLETQGVAVITYGSTHDFPGFYTPRSGFKSPWQVDNPEAAARIIDANQRLGLRSGQLFAAAIPEQYSKNADEIQIAVDAAVKESEVNGISKRGKEATPWILRRVAELTHASSISNNIALIENTAFIGGQIAREYAKLARSNTEHPHSVNITRNIPSSAMNTVSKTDAQDISPSSSPLLVVGAAALDVISQPNNSPINASSTTAHTTFPGQVRFSLGGVGRNMAEAAHRILGSHQTLLVSPIGKDLPGSLILNDTQRLGMRVDGLLVTSNDNQRSAVCNMHLDVSGNLATGVADMNIVQNMDATPVIELIDKHKPGIVALDANLNPKTISAIVQFCRRRQILTFYEPTSLPKCTAILPALEETIRIGHQQSPITFASPNRLEISHLFQEITNSSSELTSTKFWWSVMDDLNLGDSYRTELVILSKSNGEMNMFRAGLPQMATTLLPFFQHLFIKCGEYGVFVAMRLVGERALSWSKERTRPDQRLLIAKGDDSTLVMKHYPALSPSDKIVNVTGAGDSFSGSLLASLSVSGAMDTMASLDRVVKEAQCAAVLSLSSSEAVSPLLRQGLTSSD